ncbi:TPA: hypothetical protein N0F65_003531, partial [Lagenidium giganteum]
CRAAAQRLARALEETGGDVLAAVWQLERRQMLVAYAWSLLNGLSHVLFAAALLALLTAVTDTEHGVHGLRVAALVGAVMVTQVVQNLTQHHRARVTLHVHLRVVGGLHFLIMQRALRAPWVDAFGDAHGEHSDVPPSVLLRDLRTQCERVYQWVVARREHAGMAVRLVGISAVLNWYMGHWTGPLLLVIITLICRGCVVIYRRWVVHSVARFERAHAETARVLDECFKAAFPVKLYAWEGKMLTHVLQQRCHEDVARRSFLVHELGKTMLNWVAPGVTIAAVLVVLVWQQHVLSPAEVVAIVLFAQTAHDNVFSLTAWPHTLPNDELFRRFFAASQCLQSPPTADSEGNIIIKNAVVCTKQRLLFVNMSMMVKRGELAIIHGPAGSGKTTILRLLVGEIKLQSGSVSIPESATIAYCAQDHWLQTGSIRDNILLGLPFDEARYTRTLDACGLLQDINSLTRGDQTFIGPRGAKLSGGQKARVALARACYADADVYLLDCTLDCVDPLVQVEVFDKCICNLLRQKTVVLVTQNPELASSDWADRAFDVRQASVFETSRRQPSAMLLYSGLIVVSLAIIAACSWVILSVIETSSKGAFGRLVTQAMTASMEFFDGFQIGEVSFLLSNDLYLLELRWLCYLYLVVCGATDLIGRVGLIVWVGGAGAAVLMAIAMVGWWYVAKNETSRDKVFAAGKASPKHEQWVLENSPGISCIRLLGKNHQDLSLNRYAEHVNAVMKVQYLSTIHNNYIVVRYSMTEALPLLIVAFVALVYDDVGPCAFSLLVSCVLFAPRNAILLITGITNISCDLINLKRMEATTSVAKHHSETNKIPTIHPASNWPSEGEVRFDNVTFTYPSQIVKPTPVLRNVSFVVKAGEKIGLVGRTGSGKTSVAMALFRIHEVTSGRIVVDGLDTRLLGLQELRRRLSIIPQSPVFYRCSVRSYLDPFGDFDDADLWRVLQTAGLAGSGVGLVTSLDDMLAEDGVNWSVGERQLLSLARSLLKPSKVLVLDEAFSSLEQERDDAVLGIVNREFVSSTVFLITHRMDQVLGFDRILVMDNGRAVEMGSVEELLSNPDSRFYELLESSPLTK